MDPFTEGWYLKKELKKRDAERAIIEAAKAFIRCYIDAHVGKATEAQYLAAIETLRRAVEATNEDKEG